MRMSKHSTATLAAGLVAGAVLGALPAHSQDQDASDDIHWVLVVDIKEGREADFQALMEEMVAATREEEGTLAYEWLRNGDTIHLYERYEGSDAAMTHVANFGQNFYERFIDVFDVERFDVYGPASEELREGVSDFGAVHYDLVGGFVR